MWSDKSYEHRMQNFRPQHREAAEHDREYKKRLSRPEVRYLGHFRSGYVVRKNSRFEKTSIKLWTDRHLRTNPTNTARRRDGRRRSRSALSSAIFVASRQGRVKIVKAPEVSLFSNCKLQKNDPAKLWQQERNRTLERISCGEFCIPKITLITRSE